MVVTSFLASRCRDRGADIEHAGAAPLDPRVWLEADEAQQMWIDGSQMMIMKAGL